MKRPVIIWVSLFILGEIMSLRLSSVQMLICLLGVLVIIAGTPFFFKEWKVLHKKLWLIGGVFLLIGVCNTERVKNKLEWMKFCYGQNVTFTGTVIDVEEKTNATYYIIKTDYIEADCEKADKKTYNRPVKLRITLSDFRKNLSEPVSLMKGDRLKANGEGARFSCATNPGGYDEASYQYGRGIYLACDRVEVETLIRPSFCISAILTKVRNRLKKIFYVCLSEKDGSLATAMVLGDKGGLDSDVKKMYQSNGIAHLIAISGLHIAMIGGSLYKLLRRLLGGYVIPVGCGIGFIVCYGVMTGLSGATLRAVIMLALSLMAQLLGRRYDILTAVSFSLLLMLLYNPFQIVQAGFLLSFGAILGIAVIHPVWKHIFPTLPKWSDGFFVSLSVQLSLTPVMLYFFYEIPVYSIILNIIVVPVMSILLFFLLLSGFVGLFSLKYGIYAACPARLIFRFYELICHINERLPGTTMCMGRPSALWMGAYYGILILFLIVVYHMDALKMGCRMARIYLVMVMLSITSLFVVPFVMKDELMICMFDVGQGDGLYVRTPKHTNILIDGGSSSKQKVGTYVLENGLKYYGCSMLEYVIITHSDQDHYSGVKELLENDSIKIKNMILPYIENPDDAYHALESLAKQRNIKLIYMEREDFLVTDGVTFYCLNPENRSYEDKNTGSLVFLLSYMDFDMLFTGDMDETVEKELLKQKKQWFTSRTEGSLDVLKVAHHGSKTASTKEFLRMLHPKVALISAGENNRYGHPNQETLTNLEEVKCEIYNTMECGEVKIKVNQKGLVVHRYNKK